MKEEICKELFKTFEALKDIVKLAIDTNSIIPSLSASLEYIKAVAMDDPTNFEEAQLDAFGDHCFSFISDNVGAPQKGAHHVGELTGVVLAHAGLACSLYMLTVLSMYRVAICLGQNKLFLLTGQRKSLPVPVA